MPFFRRASNYCEQGVGRQTADGYMIELRQNHIFRRAMSLQCDCGHNIGQRDNRTSHPEAMHAGRDSC
jgi:hypothetical protein